MCVEKFEVTEMSDVGIFTILVVIHKLLLMIRELFGSVK